MLATAVIVFREVLEAALIIGILAAATRGVARRGRWLLGGIAVGLLGSALVAAGTEAIAQWADGLGQELFNACVLGAAVLMLAWHNIWMSSHGRELAQHARGVGEAVRAGEQTLTVVLAVVGLAVLREGSEIVLFLYGMAASGGAGSMLLGGALGLAGGVVVGVGLYGGLLRIPLRWFFAATSGLVLLLAAGMAAQAAGYLIQAGWLPGLAEPLWDTSGVLPDRSALGMLLHGLVGYSARPAATQVIVYAAAAAVIALGMKWADRPPQPRLQTQQQ